ncbi:MAG: ShlB/FhaC/HecB family hemolysin secretion/activation protein [Novosphingobium sp.]
MTGHNRDKSARRARGASIRWLSATAMVFGALPSVADAQINPPTREELEVGRPTENTGVSANRLVVEGGIERGPCPLADPSLANLKVTFSRVTFANLTAVPPETLDAAWHDMAGREVPVASLCEVRDRAATMLRQMGYLAAVQVPPQRIEKNGEVRMDVLIAKLVEVQVRGDAGAAEKRIAAHLSKLTSNEYFNVNAAERQLMLLTGMPGYTVRLTLRSAGKGPGEVVGDVLLERRPIELAVGMQNLGSQATGREGFYTQLLLNGLTGLGDRTFVALYNTVDLEEQTILQLSHEFALGTDGLRLGANFTYGRGEPGIANGNFKSESIIAGLELSYPFVLKQSRRLSGAAGFELADQTVDFADFALTEDKLRVLYARLDFDAVEQDSLLGRGGYNASEPKWRMSGSLEARQGIAGLGASKDCSPISNCLPPNVPISNIGADPSAFLVRMSGVAEYRPIPVVTLALLPRAQWSGEQLLSYEQYSLGNYTIGRGFDPGIVVGDSGIGSSFEVRYGRLQPHSAKDVALQPYAFLDAGWAWTNNGGFTPDPRRAVSAGGGLRARWGSHVDANIIAAFPVDRMNFANPLQDDFRILFTVTARVLPWKPS